MAGPFASAEQSLPDLDEFEGVRVDALLEVAAKIDVDAFVPQLVEACIAHVFIDYRDDAAFRERLIASMTQNVHALRDVIAGVKRLEDLRLDAVLSFASAQAELRVPQTLTQRSYRVSFYLQWHLWSRALTELLIAKGVGTEDALASLRSLTHIALRYQDHATSLVAATHARELDVLSRSRAHMRRSMVEDLLRGNHQYFTGADWVALGYGLEQHHVAVLFSDVAVGVADRLAAGLRSVASAHSTLVHPLGLTSSAIWIGVLDEWGADQYAAVVEHLQSLHIVATIGTPQAGIDGFRATFVQSREAARVYAAQSADDSLVFDAGAVGNEAVVTYASVRLEVLLSRDGELARTFAQSELGELAADTATARRLRDTLEASYRYGSHVSTAEHLQLHEHTVRNRLQRIEEILGHSIQDRSTELQVALRLMRLGVSRKNVGAGTPVPDTV